MGWFRGTVFTLAIALLVAGSAEAKTFKPTRTDDPFPDGCKPNNCSLREAATAAAATEKKDKILLGAKTYNLELGSSDGPVFQSDGLDLYASMVIKGRGASRTTIDANGIDRTIEIGIGISNPTARISLKGLKLTGGDPTASTSGNGGFSDGGAIVAARPRRVSLKRVVVTGNEGNLGGGISSYADTQLVIKQSTIAGNSANEGGGIDLRPALEPNTRYESRIVSSTISGNLANKGGGILADGLPGGFQDPLLSIVNSTIAGNKAANSAGGILGDNQATVDVENSSIGFNVANSDDVGLADGGGVFQYANASFSIDDSVIAHNTVGQGGDNPDCFATEVFNGAGNVLSDPTGCDVSFTTPFNRYSSDPIVKPLGNNGGPTKTLKLANGSAALGFAGACPARDQRGEKRPKNCDSGAFEHDPK